VRAVRAALSLDAPSAEGALCVWRVPPLIAVPVSCPTAGFTADSRGDRHAAAPFARGHLLPCSQASQACRWYTTCLWLVPSQASLAPALQLTPQVAERGACPPQAALSCPWCCATTRSSHA